MEGTCAHTCLNVFVERHFLGCLLRLEPQPFLWWQVWRLACVNISRTALDESKAHIRSLIAPAETVMDFTIGAPLWFAARVRARVTSPLPFRFVVAAGGRWLLAQCLFFISPAGQKRPHLPISTCLSSLAVACHRRAARQRRFCSRASARMSSWLATRATGHATARPAGLPCSRSLPSTSTACGSATSAATTASSPVRRCG